LGNTGHPRELKFLFADDTGEVAPSRIGGRQIALVSKVNQGNLAPVNFAEEIPGLHLFEKLLGMLDESLRDVSVSSFFR
jgi:hypothetical protein